MPRFFFGLLLALVACGPSKDALKQNHSSVSALIAVSDRLQKEEDLLYRLLCSESPEMELVEVGRHATLKGTVIDALFFALDHALEIGAMCRLEVRALSAGVYAQTAAYEFLSDKDLYYASSKSVLVRGDEQKSTLEIGFYKVYRDLNYDAKAVASELTFPEGTEGTFKLKLFCGEKVYNAPAMLAPSQPVHRGAFAIPYKDLAAPLSCGKLSAVKDDASGATLEVIFNPELSLSKKIPLTVAATLKPLVPDDSPATETP